MRLLVSDADQTDVQHALAFLKDQKNISVQVNPQWFKPDPAETIWIACGAPAIKMIQSAGWIPNKGGVEANRGKLFQGVQPDGWANPIAVGCTYAPQVRAIDFGDWVKFETDIALYRRFERTGTVTPQIGDYRYVEDLSGVVNYCKKKHAATGKPVELSLDTETEGLDPFEPSKRLVCIQATACPGMTDVVHILGDFMEPKNPDPNGHYYHISPRLVKIVKQLQWLVDQPWIRVIGANFKYDMLWLRVKLGIAVNNFAFDTCNGGSLVEENRPNTLNIHTKVYSPELGGYDDEFERTHDKSKMGEVPPEDLLPYAGGDTDACLRNYAGIRAELVADNMTPNGNPAKNSLASVYLNIVHPTLSALHKMEHTGVCVDTDKFHAFGADLEARMKEAQTRATKHLPKHIIDKHGGLTDDGYAPMSKPKMIADFLFSPQGLNLDPTVVTEKTKAPSTSEHHLSQFKDHPEAGPLLEQYLDYKSTSKMHGTYYKGFLNHLRADNRWHASYIIHKQGHGKGNEQDAAGTVTGRGSATAPAFQCVTGDTEILTRDGIQTAAEIIDPLIPDNAYNPYVEHKMELHGAEGWEECSNVFKSWRADLLRVRFKNGNEITCTPEHPILMGIHRGHRGLGYVKAGDLCVGDALARPKAIDRPPGPDMAPEAIEALGIVAAHGYLSVVGDRVQIEVPETLVTPIKVGLAKVGVIAHATKVVDEDNVSGVVTYHITPETPQEAVLWTLWLPHPSTPIVPKEIRGTKAWHAFLRGVFIMRRHKASKSSNNELQIRVNARSLAKAMVREAALDGIIGASYKTMKDHFRVSYRGTAAHLILKITDLPAGPVLETTDWNTVVMVAAIEEAGAGWVYDFTMPRTSAFMANGMIVHNTVPKHSYWGKRLRECIVAPDGHVIVARDYSQGEVKVAACWAGETTMIDAYRNGIDLHVLTAATVNSMSYEEAMNLKSVDTAKFKALRQNGKAGNFGLLYGMGAYGFMMYADAVYGVKLTIEEAEAMRDAYFQLYSGLPLWHERQIMEVYQTGIVRSPLGRIRHLPMIHSPIKSKQSEARRQAINSPIQGTLVDMMWWSMGIIEREKPNLLLPCGQIHDQGLWYVQEDEVDDALLYSGQVMEDLPFEKAFGWKPDLTFNTDAEVGFNLADLKEVA